MDGVGGEVVAAEWDGVIVGPEHIKCDYRVIITLVDLPQYNSILWRASRRRASITYFLARPALVGTIAGAWGIDRFWPTLLPRAAGSLLLGLLFVAGQLARVPFILNMRFKDFGIVVLRVNVRVASRLSPSGWLRVACRHLGSNLPSYCLPQSCSS